MKKNFNTAQDAFEYYYKKLDDKPSKGGTSSIKNLMIKIKNPLDNHIKTSWRKWNLDYANFEWDWYLSGDNSAIEIAKRAKIWYSCMDDQGNVNSNYGWHWKQNDQIGYVVNELMNNPNSRRASISIYDAKNRHNFENDTPCTYAINFYIERNKLTMCVMMRSNDIWFGFCNDQYFFSKLQELVANKLNTKVGSYTHFVNDFHLYNNFKNKRNERV